MTYIHSCELDNCDCQLRQKLADSPNYELMIKMYEKACEGSAEPSCILIDTTDPIKAQETIDFLDSL